ncbi:MAG TPA: hypothetical protein VNB22_22415 [Pyrinomonadaceae bacterium]|nr:hypothetical protein [Pyrinomonadaceae bacterium]
MKLFNFQIRTSLITHFLLFASLSGVSACNLENIANGKTVPAAQSENNAPKTDAESSTANQAAPETKTENDAVDAEGTYTFNNHREGKGGYENSLTIERSGKGKIHVLFEGTYFFEANGAETFHDTAAGGNLTLNGNIARGRLAEEGSGNGCAVELNFTGERVNLKSSNCDLNVTPDGVYKKGSDDEKRAESDDSKREKELEQGRVKADEYYSAFIQYDDAGAPVALVNLMEHEGERAGCGDEVKTFAGKAITVETNGDYDFEFTLVDGSRKRQKITLVVDSDDKLPYDDLRSLIKTGNNLEVRFIYCGNGGFATPTAIYKQ